MIKIIPFNEKYLVDFQYDGIEWELAKDFDVKKIIKSYAQISVSWMAIKNEKLIGVGGIFPIWQGLGQAWIFLNKETRQYKKVIFEAIKRYLSLAEKNYSQIQILCLAKNQEVTNLVEHLGFKKRELWRRYVI